LVAESQRMPVRLAWIILEVVGLMPREKDRTRIHGGKCGEVCEVVLVKEVIRAEETQPDDVVVGHKLDSRVHRRTRPRAHPPENVDPEIRAGGPFVTPLQRAIRGSVDDEDYPDQVTRIGLSIQ